MWGGGGGGASVYWDDSKELGGFKGIVVVFAWVSSKERHLRSYVNLYSSLGWSSLVCHAGFLDAFSSEKSLSLAFFILNELLKELQSRPCPVVFAAFSAGSKACMYKVFQIIQDTAEDQDEYRLVRNCVSGHIFDSSPVVLSDLGSRFALHPAILRQPGASKVLSWLAKGVSSGLDALYITRLDSQHSEYWNYLRSSAHMGAPYLFICSEDDNLAPPQIICHFARSLQGLGADVSIVKLNGSSHIGHYKHHPIQYRQAMTSLFENAALVFSQRVQRLKEERNITESKHDEISELICNLQKAAVNSNQSLRRVAVEPSDHFFLPSSGGHSSGQVSRSLEDERKETSMLLNNPPSINAHSILGQMLFDVCVPKNVEGWDIKFTGSLNGQPYASARKQSPVRNIKCTRRSRL